MVYSSDFLPAIVKFFAATRPTRAPISWATTKRSTESSAIPVKEFVNTRAIVIAGFANEVLEVNKIAPNIQIGT
jgi:hypothetical protein